MSQLQGAPRGSAGIFSTGFSDVLEQEELSSACLSALEEAGKRGSGLRTMRLVCKQASSSMLKAIRGYTVTIDGSKGQLPGMKFLLLNKLTRLRVKIKTGRGE